MSILKEKSAILKIKPELHSKNGKRVKTFILPWGGRGRWFKSSHSDQVLRNRLYPVKGYTLFLKAIYLRDPWLPLDITLARQK
jgi:hypothetical protein